MPRIGGRHRVGRPALGIDWHLAPGDVVLSPKDSCHPRLEEAAELFDYNTDYYA